MSSAAEFFANKKKKKKTFKFNANKIDAAAVTSITHVDAPALSTDHDGVAVVSSNVASLSLNEPKANDGNVAAAEQWDDEALAATYVRKGAATAGPSAAAALLDIKALDPKRGDQDDLAEKMRVEETKAQLAAAREGIERQAQRIREEKERKEQEKKGKETATASTGKWVPSHLRSSGGGAGRPMFGSSLRKQEFDVQDENLFPDLAAADAILEQQQKQQQQQLAQKLQKKPPAATGSAWLQRRAAAKAAAEDKEETASKPTEPVEDQVAETPKPPTEDVELKASEPIAEADASPPAVNEESEAGERPTEDAANTDDAESSAKIVRKKKKKKDLSTFGVSS